MKKNVKIFLINAFFLVMYSCINVGSQISAEGDNVKEVQGVDIESNYSSVQLKGPFNIVLFNGKGIRSNMADTFLQRVEITIEDDVLRIIPSRRFFPFPSDKLFIYVGTAGLRKVSIQVDGDLFTDGILRGEELTVNIEGNVSGTINSDVLRLTIASRSPGRIVLVGQAKVLTTRISSAATLSLRNFRAEEVNFHNENGSQVLMPR